MSDKTKAIVGNIAVGLAVAAGVAGVIAGVNLEQLATTIVGAGALVSGIIAFVKTLFNKKAA